MFGVLKFTLEFYLPSKQHPDFKTASVKCYSLMNKMHCLVTS